MGARRTLALARVELQQEDGNGRPTLAWGHESTEPAILEEGCLGSDYTEAMEEASTRLYM